jgi:two-component sensor histidine kinase
MRVQLCSDGWTILQGSRAPEAELRAGLDEAQLLLREAQHRARNQLQTLLAYVRRMAGDAAWFRAFEGTVATSMALQDHLRLPEVRGRVDSATFLRRLASALPGLEAGALAADVDLGVAVAARLGMVVAQLAADPGGVALRTRAEAEVLAVEVDGVGAPPPSADLGLCQGLVAQLGGSFTLAEGPPFRAVVVVPR